MIITWEPCLGKLNPPINFDIHTIITLVLIEVNRTLCVSIIIIILSINYWPLSEDRCYKPWEVILPRASWAKQLDTANSNTEEGIIFILKKQAKNSTIGSGGHSTL